MMKCIRRLVVTIIIVHRASHVNASIICEQEHQSFFIPRHCAISLVDLRGGQSQPPVRWGVPARPLWRDSSSQQQQQQQQFNRPGTYDSEMSSKEQTKEDIEAFLTRDSRQTFIARVYAILSGQLLITLGSIFFFRQNPMLVQQIIGRTGFLVPLISAVIASGVLAAMGFSVRARRNSPLKWQLLSLFTVAESLVVGILTTFFSNESVMTALGATAAATVATSAYTILQRNSKYDLSQWGMMLGSASLIFLVYMIIYSLQTSGILPEGFLPFRSSIFGLCGAVLFTLYLAYHTKLIVGGKHAKYKMNQKDYVYGAMALYVDIIEIFWYILRIVSSDGDN